MRHTRLKIERVGDGICLVAKVQPGASKNEIVGVQKEYLKIKVSAPPVKGQANRECAKILAEWLGVKTSQVKIVRGTTSRTKKIRITGDAEKLINKFNNFISE